MLSKFRINKSFLQNVWEEQAHTKLFSKEEVSEFANLLEMILAYQNQPKKRNGYTKAKVLKNWLMERGVNSKIIPVENLDSRKKANAQGKWYIVEATVGEESFEKNTINGVLLVHHDQIAKSINEFKRTQTAEKLVHPWILDDSVHVAAAMLEFVRFAKWWERYKGKYKKNISVKLLLSDGEEMNTLGVRGLLKAWKAQEILYPVDFMIIGETTGREGKVPGVAYTNSGKVLGSLHSVAKSSEPYRVILDFLIRFRIAQKQIRIRSNVSPHSKIEKVRFSKLSSTYGKVSGNGAKLFWEVRTNDILGTGKSLALFERMMKISARSLKNYLAELRKYEIKKMIDYKLKFDQIYSYVKIDGARMLQIKVERPYHPGAYDPFNMNDVFSALEVLLCAMTEDELQRIKGIDFGDIDKPNTVGNLMHVELDGEIDLDEILARIHDGGKSLNIKVLDRFRKHLNEAQDDYSWELESDKFIPPRDAIGNYDDNKWLVDIARGNFQEGIWETTGKDIEVPLTVFNAMHDGGPTTYPEYKRSVWSRGENVIVLGTGDFCILHGEEFLTVEAFLYGMLQYRGLLRKVVNKLAM